jgi:hypothetical protein
MDDFKDKGNMEIEKEALYRTLWRIGFGRDYGPVAR